MAIILIYQVDVCKPVNHFVALSFQIQEIFRNMLLLTKEFQFSKVKVAIEPLLALSGATLAKVESVLHSALSP